jgi:hypothetical protein
MKKIAPFLVFILLFTSCAFEENLIFEKIDNVKLAGMSDGQLHLTAEAFFENPKAI